VSSPGKLFTLTLSPLPSLFYARNIRASFPFLPPSSPFTIFFFLFLVSFFHLFAYSAAVCALFIASHRSLICAFIYLVARVLLTAQKNETGRASKIRCPFFLPSIFPLLNNNNRRQSSTFSTAASPSKPFSRQEPTCWQLSTPSPKLRHALILLFSLPPWPGLATKSCDAPPGSFQDSTFVDRGSNKKTNTASDHLRIETRVTYDDDFDASLLHRRRDSRVRSIR
jgi:hypothetical protein